MHEITIDDSCIEEIDATSNPLCYLILLSNGQVIVLPKMPGITVVDSEEQGEKRDETSI